MLRSLDVMRNMIDENNNINHIDDNIDTVALEHNEETSLKVNT